MAKGLKRQTFYEVYVSVIYGFVTVTGLETFLDPVRLSAASSQQWLLFAGALTTAWHFWLVCLASNDWSDSVYAMVTAEESPQVFTAFLLIDIVFATLFAAPIVVMLRAASSSPEIVLTALLALAVMSLCYDILSLVVAALAAARASALGADHRLRRFIRIYGAWLGQDVLYVVVAAGLWLLLWWGVVASTVVAVGFAVVAVCGVAWDVVIRNAALYARVQTEGQVPELPPPRKGGLTRR